MNTLMKEYTFMRIGQIKWMVELIPDELVWELDEPFWMHEEGDGSDPRLVRIEFARSGHEC